MDVDILLVLVVSKQRLGVLPAVESTHSAEGSWNNTLERIAFARAPVGSLDMGRLDLATVMNNLPFGVDKCLDSY